MATRKKKTVKKKTAAKKAKPGPAAKKKAVKKKRESRLSVGITVPAQTKEAILKHDAVLKLKRSKTQYGGDIDDAMNEHDIHPSFQPYVKDEIIKDYLSLQIASKLIAKCGADKGSGPTENAARIIKANALAMFALKGDISLSARDRKLINAVKSEGGLYDKAEAAFKKVLMLQAYKASKEG